MEIGKKLKEERMRNQWTQDYVATQLKVSRSTISSWETGRTYPDLDSLVSLSDLYEVSLDILLREDKQMTNKLTRDIKKGRKLKWFVLAIVVVTVIIGFFMGSTYKGNLLTYIFPEELISKSVSGVKEEKLTGQSNVELKFILSKDLNFDGYTKTIQDKTLYISLLGTPGYSNKDSVENVTITLNDLSEKELGMIENIYLADGRFGQEGEAISSYEYKVIWGV